MALPADTEGLAAVNAQRVDSMDLTHRRLSLASPGHYGGSGSVRKREVRRNTFSLAMPTLLMQRQNLQQVSGVQTSWPVLNRDLQPFSDSKTPELLPCTVHFNTLSGMEYCLLTSVKHEEKGHPDCWCAKISGSLRAVGRRLSSTFVARSKPDRKASILAREAARPPVPSAIKSGSRDQPAGGSITSRRLSVHFDSNLDSPQPKP